MLISRREFVTGTAATSGVLLLPPPAHAIFWLFARVALGFAARAAVRGAMRSGARTISRSTARRAVTRQGLQSGTSSTPRYIASSRTVSAPVKASKRAKQLNPSARSRLIEKLADEGTDYLVSELIDALRSPYNSGVSVPVNYNTPTIKLGDALAFRSAVPASTRSVQNYGSTDPIYTGDVFTTITNSSSESRSFDIYSYVLDVDDHNSVEMYQRGSGADISPNSEIDWNMNVLEHLYPGRKVVVTEINNEIADITKMFAVTA